MQFSPQPLLFFIFLNVPFLPSSSESNPASSPYKNCAPLLYKCGDTAFTISYPFHINSRSSYCGNPDYNITSDAISVVPIAISATSILNCFSFIVFAELGATFGFVGFFLACAGSFYIYRLKLNKHRNAGMTPKKNEGKDAHTIEAFLANFGSLATKRYAYSDIKRMTKSFTDKIGQGGYGSVYKGKLFNGHPVAIKILNETKGNGEDFINEVAAIGRTSHVNVVSLLGFCVEGSKRALIYDFMSNGSLDKYIYLDKLDTSQRTLGWEELYRITIGIARGLEYLHRGCNTRIVHFDIKPHNILLDQDFCPKISDFGMAKLCLPKESIISMCGARGTIGYIAPEVFSRTFGVVSSKSDVYSYGMMLLELFGTKRKNIAGFESVSENYFPQSIYQHIEIKGHPDANEYGLTEEYEEIAKKIMIVGFWCIQTIPEFRPTISRVVEMLEGSIDDLSIPPKPILSSPLDLVMSLHTTSSS